MLYRAVGRVLFVQSPGARMLIPLSRAHRIRRRPSPPPRIPAPAPAPIRPAWTPDDEARWAVDRPAGRIRRSVPDGRWRRVSYWWIFSADELDRIIEAL